MAQTDEERLGERAFASGLWAARLPTAERPAGETAPGYRAADSITYGKTRRAPSEGLGPQRGQRLYS